jgi:hypothetical protein
MGYSMGRWPLAGFLCAFGGFLAGIASIFDFNSSVVARFDLWVCWYLASRWARRAASLVPIWLATIG